IKAASHTIIVLSSATAIREVVDKMGWIASSRRPTFSSISAQTVFTGSTPELKAIRKAIATFFSRQNAAKRSPIKAESAQLLYELMEFRSSVRRFTHSAIK
ncbi:hypothetical protein BDZ89DRAFT_1064605, partial [Hymenopellis radicata]